MKNKILLFSFFIYLAIDLFYFPAHTIFPDESRFFEEALYFSKHFQFKVGDNYAWEMPLTAIIYSFFMKFGDLGVYLIRIFQAVLLVIDGILVYKISYLLFKNKNISLISMIITLFYPFFIYYQGLLLSESLFINFLLFAFYFLYRWKNENFQVDKNLFFTILFFGLSLYVKATLTILPIFLIPFFVLFYKGLKYSLKIFGIVFIGYILLMSFWWIRNYFVLDKFVLFTTSSGANLYLGNNKFNKNGGIDWGADVDKKFVYQLKNSNLDEVEKDKMFKQKAIMFIKENPKEFFFLMSKKFIRFWNIQFNNEKFKKSIYNYIRDY
jgi:4-amino-4-deoxy-L-arabinose transferase-like glycosyltransferase